MSREVITVNPKFLALEHSISPNALELALEDPKSAESIQLCHTYLPSKVCSCGKYTIKEAEEE